MIDELTRQCEMAWERGRDYGLACGIVGSIIGVTILHFIGL